MPDNPFLSELKGTAAALSRRGKGILAADESVGTIGKRLAALSLENTAENRRAFREILICAPNNEASYAGIILFHETLYQSDSNGTPFVDILNEKGILIGVKVDTGLKPFDKSPGETVTSGLDGLKERCEQYYRLGARFAKWRAALKIDRDNKFPSGDAIAENCIALAKYAAIAQSAGLVPIVEPEILIDGSHNQHVSAEVARLVLAATFDSLESEKVAIDATLLKPMMVMPGVKSPDREFITPEQIASATLQVVKAVVPEELPGIMFLSGGMTERQATENLDALNRFAQQKGAPWTLSFSFGRALQTSPMDIWAGKKENAPRAMEVAAKLGEINAKAQLGKYVGGHPSVAEGNSLYEGFRGWRSGEDPKGV